MNGTRALRIIAFMSISIGIGILSRAAWGFVAFGILVLIDNFVIPYSPPAPPDRAVAEREIMERTFFGGEDCGEFGQGSTMLGVRRSKGEIDK